MLRRLAWRAMMAARLDRRIIAGCVPALATNGWMRSRDEQRCVDAAGEPIPWLTYPAIAFLARRVRADMTVFEYGSGASTLWWAARVRQVVAVEHDARWVADLTSRLPPNATVVHVEEEPSGAYARNVLAHGVSFDVVVVDGRDRVRCVPNALRALTPGGVVVFDNSDRAEYEAGYRALHDAGFRKVEFVGLAPLIGADSETAIYYRPGNCLGL
jgi:SAM-dependent methyltransferase